MASGTDIVTGDCAGREIVLAKADERPELTRELDLGRVAVAVDAAGEALVDPGELLAGVVEPLGRESARARVDGPAVERGGLRGSRAEGVDGERLVVADDVDDDVPVRIVVRVHRVEDVAGIHVDPRHVGVATVPRHHADTCLVLRIPRSGKWSLAERREIEDDRKVEPHDLRSRDRKVVDHRRSADGDLLGPRERAMRIDDVVPEPRRSHDVVPEEHELIGQRVDLRVRRHR